MELSFEELVKAISGEIIVDNNNRDFNCICTDTRKIEENNIFIALNGENFNGNKYVKSALEKGASISIVDEILFDLEEVLDLGVVIKVDNCYDALLSLAKYYREKLNIKIIGVTGSTGKTSTKDLVAAFLSDKYKVFKTKGNFNNHIGLPLMILELDSSIDVAVLELGMSDLGEIHILADCARPDIALITNIGLSHIENLKTRENILKAKLEITDFFKSENILIVNGEDEYLAKVKSNEFEIIKTGYNKGFDYIANNIILSEKSTSFTVNDGEEEHLFKLPMVGAHNVLNALLGIAASRALGVSYAEMVNGLENIESTSMRLEFIEKAKFTIINDCYNASPASMEAALDVLNNTKGNRKIAILGTMNELGDEAERAHMQVGEYANGKVDILITTGSYKNSYEKGFDKEKIKIYNTKEDIIKDLKNIVAEDDIILIKASRGIKFEEIVRELEKM